MEFVILGLLLIRNLSQYDMKNALQQKISPFFSPSLGSIQAALKKLERNGQVSFNEVVESGRRKKIYTINEVGKKYFMDWMLSPVAPGRLEQEVTTRLFFLGLMQPIERLAMVEAVIAQLESTVREFEDTSIEANQKEVPENLKNVVTFQMKTLELGLFYHKNMLEWFKKLSAELEEKLNESCKERN